jgi:hypothetical protein
MVWSLVLGAVGVFGLYLAGRKSWVGWAINAAAQLLWLAYAIVTEQYGFIITALAYGWVYLRNLRAWWLEERAQKEVACAWP